MGLNTYVTEPDHAKEVDFLVGDDKYREIWMSNRHERWGIVAYNPRTQVGFGLLQKEILARTTKMFGAQLNQRLKHIDRCQRIYRKEINAGSRAGAHEGGEWARRMTSSRRLE